MNDDEREKLGDDIVDLINENAKVHKRGVTGEDLSVVFGRILFDMGRQMERELGDFAK